MTILETYWAILEQYAELHGITVEEAERAIEREAGA